eukprot:Gb_38506 [translate_table: standard]
MIVANTFGAFALLILLLLGKFLMSYHDIKGWWIWGYWVSPLMYGQNSITVNEFLGHKYDKLTIHGNNETLGVYILKSCALGKPQAVVSEQAFWDKHENRIGEILAVEMTARSRFKGKSVEEPRLAGSQDQMGATADTATGAQRRGMVLPFQPLSIAFDDINLHVADGRGSVNDIAVKHYNNLIDDLLEQGNIQFLSGSYRYSTLRHSERLRHSTSSGRGIYGGWISPRIVFDLFQKLLNLRYLWQPIATSDAVPLSRRPPPPQPSTPRCPPSTPPWPSAGTLRPCVRATPLDFTLGWIFNSIFYGDYLASMCQIIGSHLPKFSEEERLMVMDSLDFIALHHYTTMYVVDVNLSSPPRDYYACINYIDVPAEQGVTEDRLQSL